MSAPERIYADRGPRGGWMFREERMPDTVAEYVRADLFATRERELAEARAETEVQRESKKYAQRCCELAEARATASERQVEAMEKALEEAEETLRLVEHPAFKDPIHAADVEALGDRIGYGALMSSASASWRERAGNLAGSEFVAGPCHGTVVRTLAIIRAAILNPSEKNNG